MLTGLCLKTFQHKGLRKCQKKRLQASSCPVWKCNYISVSIRSSKVRCRKPDTSSLSSAKLAFSECHIELLDSSSAGICPSFFFALFFFGPLYLSAPISLLQCQPRPFTLQSIAGALFHSPCGSLSSAYNPSYHFLPLSLYFPFPLFPGMFLKQAKRASR